jgi:hypothetical protein
MTISIRLVYPDLQHLRRLNSIEPPWYVTRMPGGVTGTAREGQPMSIMPVIHGKLTGDDSGAVPMSLLDDL